jgi:RNA polymerase sigma factor (TIGR02999 family)
VPDQDITDLLVAYREGDQSAFERLVPLVYDDLRRIARQQLARHRRDAVLDTTALVHETYLKLVDQTRVEAIDRTHFLAIAARAVRQVIVDYARSQQAAKRGAGQRPVSLDRVQVVVGDASARQIDFLLAIDQALERMSEASARLTRVFECRYFGGLTEQETAEALGLPLRTIQRDWMKSKAWLRRELSLG